MADTEQTEQAVDQADRIRILENAINRSLNRLRDVEMMLGRATSGNASHTCGQAQTTVRTAARILREAVPARNLREAVRTEPTEEQTR